MRHGNRRVRRDCCVIPSVSRRPRRSVCPRPTPEKARPRRTARIGPRSPTTSGRPARTTCDSASFQTKTEYSFRGPFTPEGIAFRGLTDQGFGAWPFGGFDRRLRSPESGTARMCRTSYPRTRSLRHPTQCSRPVEGAYVGSRTPTRGGVNRRFKI